MLNPKPKYNCTLSAHFSRLELAQEDLPPSEEHLYTESRQGRINITGGNGSQVKEKTSHGQIKTEEAN